ncbi:MAG: nucleoside phosphorylase [Oscillospiraceae bacterium]|nr:nucleoside phosphorylase [Oscillospiraceae bacterium]
MSIIDAYDSSTEAVLQPGDIAAAVPGFPEVAVAAFQLGAVDALVTARNLAAIDEFRVGRPVPIYAAGIGDGAAARDAAVYWTPLGGPLAAVAMEEIIAKGARKFVFFGSCGVLDSALEAGHFIVPTYAYRDEGTSYHYVPAGDWMRVETAGRVEEIFRELGVNFVSGRVWTTDALYRETRGRARKRREDGCIAVDMECASLAAVSAHRGVPVYHFLYAEDSLDGQEWDRRTMGSVASDAHGRYMDLALEIAARV